MLLKYQYKDFKLRLEVLNYKENELDIIRKAAFGMARCLGDPAFKEFCLNYSYKVKYYKWVGWKKKYYYKEFKQFYRTGGRTNLQVYNHIMSGQESCPELTEIDQEADVFLKIDRRYKPGVVGWTRPEISWQYLYEWVLKKKDWVYISGNLCHEWLHKLGYSHAKMDSSNPHKRHTPTYACGNWVRRFLKETMNNYVEKLD